MKHKNLVRKEKNMSPRSPDTRSAYATDALYSEYKNTYNTLNEITPFGDDINLLISDYTLWDSEEHTLENMSAQGRLPVVIELIESKEYASNNLRVAFIEAITNGHLDVVKYLLSVFKSKDENIRRNGFYAQPKWVI
jgi:hypothetical protein